jgi:uncharacterized protein (DUF2236 family)
MEDGLFDDAAVIRRVAREGLLLAGGGRATLLQIAHPGVARGVHDHSDFAARPADRLRGTLSYAYAVLFGTREEARTISRAVTAMHRRVIGPGYSAADPDLLVWVNATLYDTATMLYQRVVGPLTPADADVCYRQYSVLATSIGCPANAWPADRQAFAAYWARMIGTLRVHPEAPATGTLRAGGDAGAMGKLRAGGGAGAIGTLRAGDEARATGKLRAGGGAGATGALGLDAEAGTSGAPGAGGEAGTIGALQAGPETGWTGALRVGPEARAIAKAVLWPRHLPVALRPGLPLNRFVTIGLLPAPVRDGYGFAWSPHKERLLDRGLTAASWVYPNLPPAVREAPKDHYLKDLRRRSARRRHTIAT